MILMVLNRAQTEVFVNERINVIVNELEGQRSQIGQFGSAKVLDGVSGALDFLKAMHVGNALSRCHPEQARKVFKFVRSTPLNEFLNAQICRGLVVNGENISKNKKRMLLRYDCLYEQLPRMCRAQDAEAAPVFGVGVREHRMHIGQSERTLCEADNSIRDMFERFMH